MRRHDRSAESQIEYVEICKALKPEDRAWLSAHGWIDPHSWPISWQDDRYRLGALSREQLLEVFMRADEDDNLDLMSRVAERLEQVAP